MYVFLKFVKNTYVISIKWIIAWFYMIGWAILILFLEFFFFKAAQGDIMDDETLKVFAYVNISTYRVRAVKALDGEVKTPANIAKDADIKLNHISKTLHQLKDCGVAVCINENVKRGRLYRLTSVGEEIVDYLDNMG